VAGAQNTPAQFGHGTTLASRPNFATPKPLPPAGNIVVVKTRPAA
jgi:hypothetical protein